MSTSSQFSIKPQVVDLVSTNYRRISTPLPCPGSEEVITNWRNLNQGQCMVRFPWFGIKHLIFLYLIDQAICG